MGMWSCLNIGVVGGLFLCKSTLSTSVVSEEIDPPRGEKESFRTAKRLAMLEAR